MEPPWKCRIRPTRSSAIVSGVVGAPRKPVAPPKAAYLAAIALGWGSTGMGGTGATGVTVSRGVDVLREAVPSPRVVSLLSIALMLWSAVEIIIVMVNEC